MERSASTATTFGITIDELIGLISAIGIQTRESGSVIGNSIKTISSRITTMQPSIDALAEIGINVRDSAGEMRSVFDILEELAGKWNKLSAEQQQNMAVTLAGRFQLSRFLVLMQQWQTVTDVTTTSLNSQGSAMREQEEYSKSLEARLNRLSNAGVEVSQAIGDAFLTDGIVTFAETMSSIANSSQGVIRFVGALPPIFGALATVLALVSTRFKTAMLDMNMFKRSADGLTISLKGLRAGIASLGATLGIGLGFAALGFVFEKLIGVIGDYIQSIEEFNQAHQASLESIENERDRVNELVDEYERLSNIDRNIKQEERYTELQNELAQLLPSVIAYEDEKGNKILKNTELVREYIDALDEQIAKEREMQASAAPTIIALSTSNIEKAENKILDLEREIEEYYEEMAKRMEKGNIGMAKQWDLMIQGTRANMQRQRDTIVEELENIALAYDAVIHKISADQQLNLSVNEVSWISQMAQDAKVGLDQLDEFTLRIADFRNSFYELTDEVDLTAFTNDQIGVIRSLVQNLEHGSIEWGKYGNLLQDSGVKATTVNQIFGSLRHSQEDLTQSARDAGVSLQTHKPIFDELGESINWVTNETYAQIIASEDLDDVLGNLGDEVDELLESYNSHISAIKELNGIINELNEGHGISADTISLIIEKYPALLDHIHSEAELRKAVEEAVQREAQVSEEAIFKKLQDNENFFNQLIKGNEQLFGNILPEGYNTDLSKFKSLAQAKADVENHLLQGLTRAWNEYFGATTQQMNMFINEQGQMTKMAYDTLRWFPSEIMGAAADAHASYYNQLQKFQRGFTEISVGAIGVNFSGVGLNPIKTSAGKSGSGRSPSSKKGKDTSAADAREAARLAEEAQRRVLEIVQRQIELYQQRVNALNDNISLEEYYLAKYEQTDKQYRERQQNIASLKRQQAEYHAQTIRYIERQLKTNKKLNQEQREELEKTLISTRQTYYGVLKDIDSINKSIKQSYESIADEVIQVYKSMYQQMKDIALKANQEELDALKKSHDEKMKMLDEELSAYEELINAKIKLIDKEQDEEDFQKELSKKQEERLDLLRRIDRLSMDDSMDARRQVSELKEELSDKEMEIEEFLSNRERELRKASLQKQLEDKREQIEVEREMDTSEMERKRLQLEQEREEIERHYENLLNDERAFAKMRENILSGNIKNMSGQLRDFAKFVRNNMSTIGKSISNNLIDQINEAQKKLNSINKSYKQATTKTTVKSTPPKQTSTSSSSSKTSSSSSSPSGSTPKVGGKVKVNTKNANAYMDSYGRQVRPWADQAKAAGISYGQSLYMVNERAGYAALSKTNNINGVIAWVKKSDLIGLNTGGLLGNFSGGRIAELHANELVSNPVDTENLLKASSILEKIMPHISNKTPVLNKKENSQSVQHNKFEFNIDNLNGTREGANDFFKQLNDELRDIGVRFT